MARKKRFSLRNILLFLIAIFILIQFIRIDKDNPAFPPENDFIATANPGPEIAGILKNACYDCHSFQTAYPWYSNIAPVSWWLKNHINEGREELNFNLWRTYSAKRKDRKLKGCVKLVTEGEMPLDSYTWIHSKAKLTSDQRSLLAGYFKSLTSGMPASEDDD